MHSLSASDPSNSPFSYLMQRIQFSNLNSYTDPTAMMSSTSSVLIDPGQELLIPSTQAEQHQTLMPLYYPPNKANRGNSWAIQAEVELCAPPPTPKLRPQLGPHHTKACPSPYCDMVHVNQRFEEKWSPLQLEFATRSGSPTSRPTAVAKTAPKSLDQSGRRRTPLRQTLSLSEDEDDRKSEDPDSTALSLLSSHAIPNGVKVSGRRLRGMTLPNLNLTERKQSTSSEETKLLCPTSPTFGISRLRRTVQSLPTSQSRIRSPSLNSNITTPRPPLGGKQISSPRITSSSTDPKIVLKPPKSSLGKNSSWPGSYRPSRASPCPPSTEESQSFWSDSEDDEKDEKKMLLSNLPRRRKNFRRSLSETFRPLLCGSRDPSRRAPEQSK